MGSLSLCVLSMPMKGPGPQFHLDTTPLEAYLHQNHWNGTSPEISGLTHQSHHPISTCAEASAGPLSSRYPGGASPHGCITLAILSLFLQTQFMFKVQFPHFSASLCFCLFGYSICFCFVFFLVFCFFFFQTVSYSVVQAGMH